MKAGKELENSINLYIKICWILWMKVQWYHLMYQ